ncbi:hypothetical protein FKP32DRAFT_1568896 [Trametes sanguinea]|nr:hypothetical protein FKP32DRAFT_1568896 [Trametes sanguinea]
MDGKIGVKQIKHFNVHTSCKANSCPHLLVVDGHNSHYTLAFLLYAIEHLIIVLYYGAHTAHIYSGLDVIIVAILKVY